MRPPKASADAIAIQQISDTQLKLANNGMVYQFQKIFSLKSSQSEVFEHVSFPLVRDLLSGQNGELPIYILSVF